MSPRQIYVFVSVLSLAGVAVLGRLWEPALWALLVVLPVVLLGLYDFCQSQHAIRRNFPVAGRFRYLFEAIRPEIHQYFVESNSSGRPFSRELRSLVYRRAKNVTDTLPFGTEYDVVTACLNRSGARLLQATIFQSVAQRMFSHELISLRNQKRNERGSEPRVWT